MTSDDEAAVLRHNVALILMITHYTVDQQVFAASQLPSCTAAQEAQWGPSSRLTACFILRVTSGVLK